MVPMIYDSMRLPTHMWPYMNFSVHRMSAFCQESTLKSKEHLSGANVKILHFGGKSLLCIIIAKSSKTVPILFFTLIQ